MEGHRLVGQEPQLREEAGWPSLAQGGGSRGLSGQSEPRTDCPSPWLPPSLPTGIGKGHACPSLRHETGQGAYSWPLLCPGPHPDLCPPKSEAWANRTASAAGAWTEIFPGTSCQNLGDTGGPGRRLGGAENISKPASNLLCLLSGYCRLNNQHCLIKNT